MDRLLIVDDNRDVCRQLKWGLAREPYERHFAYDAAEALELFERLRPGVVTLDLGLPPDENGTAEGLDCLEKMLRVNPYAKVIIITGNEEREAALKAVQYGAYDYYRKPIDLAELKVIIDRAFYLQGLEDENRKLRQGMAGSDGIVGQCPMMQKVFEQIEKVGATDLPVLVTGESGTGKELVAKAIHNRSDRAEAPMITINCGAIPENLLESELFGHEKGAFTGAIRTVKGKAEYAHTGTLFLDEIGDLPLALQVKILRFLQEKVIQRVGGREDIQLDVRIIAATNQDIHKALEEGSFRDDLFYRISVVNILLPPLRDRGEDVKLLANYFLKRFGEGAGSSARKFSREALGVILGYDWPGNIRELENRIRRAVIMASGPEIMPADLGLGEDEIRKVRPGFGPLTLKEARAQLEREMVQKALERFSGNVARAASALGISRPTFYDLLKKHGIEH